MAKVVATEEPEIAAKIMQVRTQVEARPPQRPRLDALALSELAARGTSVWLFGCEFRHARRDDSWVWFALEFSSVSQGGAVCGIRGHITLCYIAGESAHDVATRQAEHAVGDVLRRIGARGDRWHTRLVLNEQYSSGDYAIYDLVVHDRAHETLFRVCDTMRTVFGNALRPRPAFHLSVQRVMGAAGESAVAVAGFHFPPRADSANRDG